MAGMAWVFGATPRIRLLEACVALASYEFTRAELAEEAGLVRASANRHVTDLVDLGVLLPIPGSRPLRFRVDVDSPVFHVVALAGAAAQRLHLTHDQQRQDGAEPQDDGLQVDRLRDRLAEALARVQGSPPGPGRSDG